MPEAATYTYADLASFPDDGLRREIIGGELIVSPAPKVRHQDLVGRLFLEIANHLRAFPDGRVLLAPCDVVLSDTDVVEPDLIFIASAHAGIIGEANINGTPSLVIEVVSNSRMDRVRKRDLYATTGIAEYWIVDPDADRVEVLLLSGDRYDAPSVLEPGATLTTPLLPNLRIELADLFQR